MNPQALRRWCAWAVCACAAALCGAARAGDEAKAPGAAADALKPFDDPKRIDIEGKGLKLDEVLAKLETHYGWKLGPSTADTAKRTVDLEIKGATYFEALDAIRRAAKLGYADAESRDPKVLPLALCELGEKGCCLAVPKGPFLFRVSQVSCQASREAAFGQAPGERQAYRNATVSICSEPGLKLSAPKIEKGFMVIGQGEKHDTHVWLSDIGFSTPGAAKKYTPMFASVRDAEGSLALGGTLVVQVPQSVERRVIEDLGAQIGKTVDLGGGSLEIKKYIDTDRGVTLPFIAKGCAKGMVTAAQNGGMRMMVAVAAAPGGGGNLEDLVPKDQPGFYFFDAERHLVANHGLGSSGSEEDDEIECNMRLPVRPKGVILQWAGKMAERSVDFEIAGIPAP